MAWRPLVARVARVAAGLAAVAFAVPAGAGDPPPTAFRATTIAEVASLGCGDDAPTALDVRRDGSILLACGDRLRSLSSAGQVRPFAPELPLVDLAPEDAGTHVGVLRELADGRELIGRVRFELSGCGTWLYRSALGLDGQPQPSDGRLLAALPGLVVDDAAVGASGMVYLAATEYRIAEATGMIVGIAPVGERLLELSGAGEVRPMSGGALDEPFQQGAARCRGGPLASATFGRLVSLAATADGRVLALDQSCWNIRAIEWVPGRRTGRPEARVATLLGERSWEENDGVAPEEAIALAGTAASPGAFLVTERGVQLLQGQRLRELRMVGTPWLDLDAVSAELRSGRPLVAAAPDGALIIATAAVVVRLAPAAEGPQK